MKLLIDQSPEHCEVEITIRCGMIDERLSKLIEQIRMYSFSVTGKREGRISQTQELLCASEDSLCYTILMKVNFENNKAIVTGVREFDPKDIFDNGQAFRFTQAGDGAWAGVACGRLLRVRQEGDAVVLFPVTEKEFHEIWKGYFDLDRDYGALFNGCEDEALREGRRFAPGLRVLNQEPFEALVSTIISANNNIGRIRGIVQKICEACGEPFEFEGKTYYAFPTPARLASMTEQQLKNCGCGYRAPYIRDAARMVAEGYDLGGVAKLPYAEAKKKLTELPGVGPKVADCVLLFGMGKTDAFPADVWINRVMKELYGFTGSHAQIYDYAVQKFGMCAGIAQQYLFYYAKENKIHKK